MTPEEWLDSREAAQWRHDAFMPSALYLYSFKDDDDHGPGMKWVAGEDIVPFAEDGGFNLNEYRKKRILPIDGNYLDMQLQRQQRVRERWGI